MAKSFGGAKKSYGGPVTYYCETCHLQIPPTRVIRYLGVLYHKAIVSKGGPFGSIQSDQHLVIEVPTHPSEM